MGKNGRFILKAAGISAASALLLLGACAAPPGAAVPPSSTPPPSVAAQAEKDAVLLTVDGHPVTHEEFMLFAQKQRAATAQYFSDTYGAQTGPGFWTNDYGGETPSDYCKTLALEEIIQFKAELTLAMERGLTEHVDYSDLMSDRESVNRENAERMERGEAVFGLPSLDPWPYLLKLRADCETKLLEYEQDLNAAAVSEETLRARYEAEADYYQQTPEITYERLTAAAGDSDVDWEAALHQIAQAAREGAALSETARELLPSDGYEISVETNTQVQVGKDDLWEQAVQERLLTLQPGEASDPFFMGGTWYLLRCTGRVDPGPLPFEEVRSNVLYQYSRETLEHTLEAWAADAEIVFPDGAFDALIVS